MNTTKLMEKPEPPASNECCGSGSCCPCVWDYYREQLVLWQQQTQQSAVPAVLESILGSAVGSEVSPAEK